MHKNVAHPNAFQHIRFSDGTRRLVMQSETGLIDDCYESDEPVRIDSTTQTFFVQLAQGGGNVTLGNALALRATGQAQAITAPDNNYPAPVLAQKSDYQILMKFFFAIQLVPM